MKKFSFTNMLSSLKKKATEVSNTIEQNDMYRKRIKSLKKSYNYSKKMLIAQILELKELPNEMPETIRHTFEVTKNLRETLQLEKIDENAYCPNCKEEIEFSQKYCSKCGYPNPQYIED